MAAQPAATPASLRVRDAIQLLSDAKAPLGGHAAGSDATGGWVARGYMNSHYLIMPLPSLAPLDSNRRHGSRSKHGTARARRGLAPVP